MIHCCFLVLLKAHWRGAVYPLPLIGESNSKIHDVVRAAVRAPSHTDRRRWNTV